MRLLLELQEQPVDRLTEVLADRALDVLEGERPHVVLQRAQLADDVRRDDVRTGRQQLAELHERRAELVEQLTEMVAAWRDALGAADVSPARAMAFDHVAEAVPDRYLGDFAQAPEVPLLLAGLGHPGKLRPDAARRGSARGSTGWL